MTQEIKVNITLTLEGGLNQSKADIENFVADMMINAIATKSFSIQDYYVHDIQLDEENNLPNRKHDNEVWEFVERYYPKYYSCDEIMRNDDLCKIVDGELNGDAEIMFREEFNEVYQQAVVAFEQSCKYIFERAIEGFQSVQKDSISIVWTLQDVEDRAKHGGHLLREGEAQQVLMMLKEKHDCTLGINWDTIDSYLEYLVLKNNRSELQ